MKSACLQCPECLTFPISRTSVLPPTNIFCRFAHLPICFHSCRSKQSHFLPGCFLAGHSCALFLLICYPVNQRCFLHWQSDCHFPYKSQLLAKFKSHAWFRFCLSCLNSCHRPISHPVLFEFLQQAMCTPIYMSAHIEPSSWNTLALAVTWITFTLKSHFQ